MQIPLQIRGLWVPIITPFFQGQLDEESLIALIKDMDPNVDGFVPCLSSGEGGKMNDALWERVVTIVVRNTNKPVAAGILHSAMEKIVKLSEKAKALGCIAVAIPLQGESAEDQKNFCKEISDNSHLPIILYNTEKVHIDSADTLIEIAQNASIISLKDSSQNDNFFQEALRIKREGKATLSLLQGMENKLLSSAGCDGYLISLANVEPVLCKNLLNNPSEALNDEVMKRWDEFNLASETWYVGIKKALFSRGKIKSAELIS